LGVSARGRAVAVGGASESALIVMKEELFPIHPSCAPLAARFRRRRLRALADAVASRGDVASSDSEVDPCEGEMMAAVAPLSAAVGVSVSVVRSC
jgi:hypothetical protein